jgi:hypothetical protein
MVRVAAAIQREGSLTMTANQGCWVSLHCVCIPVVCSDLWSTDEQDRVPRFALLHIYSNSFVPIALEALQRGANLESMAIKDGH